jgi:hypothetical protein
MFTTARFDNDYVPYTKRPVLKRTACLFIDGAGSKASGGARVVSQQTLGMSCHPGDQCKRNSCAEGSVCWYGQCTLKELTDC